MKKLNCFEINKKGGAAGTIVFIIVLILSIVIYIGYKNNLKNHYINLYDNQVKDLTIEIPPFTERLTDPDKELIGECDLKVGTSFEQVCSFYQSYASKCGFYFEALDNSKSFNMTVRKGYTIKGTPNNNIMELRWIPVLNYNQVDKAKKLFGDIKREP